MEEALRIVTWNLNHRAKRRSIPNTVARGILSLQPDVLVLTEYVEGDDHSPFCGELCAEGLTTTMTTEPVRGENQVLIASRVTAKKLVPGSEGAVFPPRSLGVAHLNWLHVRLNSPSVDIVGMRVPEHKKGATRGSYWKWFESEIDPLFQRASLIIGDFNCDPNSNKTGTRALRELRQRGWQWSDPDPQGEMSYRGAKCASRIDHVLASPSVEVISARYVPSANGFDFIGPRPLSDHSPLLVVIGCR